MEEWIKWKRLIKRIGIVGGVYLCIRYILPLIVPFLLAGILAKCITPAVNWLHRRLHINQTIGAILMILLVGTVLFGGGYFLGSRLLRQLEGVAGQVPQYWAFFRSRIEGCCGNIEGAFGLRPGCMMEQLLTMAEHAWRGMQESAGSYLTSHLLPFASFCLQAGAFLVIVIIAAVYWIQEREIFRNYRRLSAFRKELNTLIGHCTRVGGAYIRVELIIMLITTVLCVCGLFLLRIPYALLAGVLIGLLDALPFFGTGTVFIPWILIDLVRGDFLHGIAIAALYAICYLVREIMESRLLGERIGMTALETMASMYIGWQLFGLWGLFLGPIAWILIKEIDKNEKVI